MLDIRNLVRGGRAVVSLIKDSDRLDQVFELVDAVNAQPDAARRLMETVAQDSQLAHAVLKRPRLGRVDMDALAQLPEGTLGRAFVGFLRQNGLDPNALPVREADDAVSYLQAHLLETHDLWHVVTGFGPDPVDELGLQAFYLAQNHSRVALSIIMTGVISTFLHRFDRHEAMMTRVTRGWLLGRRAKRLIGTDWKQLMDRPLEEVRTMFGLDLARVDALLGECEAPRPTAPVAQA
ncbi:Coq4 family protein [Vitiosangium sp. GDMCC 1.1324]|uniref:Coq4 family protein n=1 Tax=Vitiosangium sp. (strain GDMCC 1.1324) TaxID=2138576 RepID=UPI000D389FF6|nr:Coq4 family protein [Vitiosangium sp. GDMCC 1.1324]PTL75884.1 hypothetical protein DAT35_52315 [Vitiosangium sp. GDMCC 1.1324]